MYRYSRDVRKLISAESIILYSLSRFGRVVSRKTYSAYPGDVLNQFFIV